MEYWGPLVRIVIVREVRRFDDKLIAYRDPDQASEELYRKGEVKWPLLMECSMAVLSGWMSIDWCPFLPLKRCDTTNGMWPMRWSLGWCRGDFTQGQDVRARVQRVTVIGSHNTPTHSHCRLGKLLKKGVGGGGVTFFICGHVEWSEQTFQMSKRLE